MEIPGLSPLSNQPTLTNPLTQGEKLQGQQTQAQTGSESTSTTTVSQQASSSLSKIEVVNQANEAAEIQANNDSNANLGANIDIIV